MTTKINTTPNFEAIPQELKELKRWIVWKLKKTDKFKKNGDVKYTKPPYSAKTGRKSSITNKKTWATFEEAKAVFEKGGYAGIGFVFVRGDGYVGVDLDECFDEYGEFNEYGKQAFTELRSYTEYSPSRDGIHAIVRGELPGKGHCDNPRGIEMYDEGRFFTFTGDVYGGRTTIEDRKLEIKSLYHDWFDGANGSSGAGSAKPGAYKFDPKAEIKELDALQLPQDVVDLVRDGTGMDQFKDDRSLAIFVISRIMLNAGANPETIATIFSDPVNFLSGAALSRRSGNIDSARCWLLDQIIMKQKAAYDADMALLCDDDFDDDGEFEVSGDVEKLKLPVIFYTKDYERNAVRFLTDNKVKRFCGQYFFYDGLHWKAVSEEVIHARVNAELGGKSLAKSVKNDTFSEVKLRAVVEEFEFSSSMIAFRNGVVDLRGWDTGELRLELKKHQPKFNITSLLDYDYDACAKCPQWLAFLNASLEGDPDRIRQLQQWIGYFLVKDNRHQKMLILVGKSRSGKGVIMNIVGLLVGEGASVGTSLTSLAGAFGVVLIANAKVATMGDAHQTTKQGIIIAKELLLNITGGDKVAVNRKHRDEKSMHVSARLVMSCNQIPMFYDDYDALNNRYSILPFNVSFAKQPDRDLPVKLKEELSGIFNWAVEGLLDLGRSGSFCEGEESQRKRRELRERQNPFGAFIAKYCEEGSEYCVPMGEMHEVYQRFCEVHEFTADSGVKFYQRVEDSVSDVSKKRMRGSRGDKRPMAFFGLRLRQDAVAELLLEAEGF